MWSIFTWINDSIWTWWSSRDSKLNTCLLLGLDNTGKTVLTKFLIENHLIQTIPTIRGSKHKVKIGSTIVTIIDGCDSRQARRLICDDMFNSIRLIFMIDASDRERLPEARSELLNLLQDDQMQSVPILILANKIDRTNTAYNENELRDLLQIEKYLNKENSHIKLCMCSLVYRVGFVDGLQWLIKKS